MLLFFIEVLVQEDDLTRTETSCAKLRYEGTVVSEMIDITVVDIVGCHDVDVTILRVRAHTID